MTFKDSMFTKSGQHLATEELILETNLTSTRDVNLADTDNTIILNSGDSDNIM